MGLHVRGHRTSKGLGSEIAPSAIISIILSISDAAFRPLAIFKP